MRAPQLGVSTLEGVIGFMQMWGPQGDPGHFNQPPDSESETHHGPWGCLLGSLCLLPAAFPWKMQVWAGAELLHCIEIRLDLAFGFSRLTLGTFTPVSKMCKVCPLEVLAFPGADVCMHRMRSFFFKLGGYLTSLHRQLGMWP